MHEHLRTPCPLIKVALSRWGFVSCPQLLSNTAKPTPQTMNPETSAATPAADAEWQDLSGDGGVLKKISCFLNAAQASINDKEWADAITHSTSVLAKDADTVKALFRRGVARRHTGMVDESKEDLMGAYKLDPNNKAVRKELQLLKASIKEAKDKAKTAFGGLLGKVSMYGDKEGAVVLNGNNPSCYFDVKLHEKAEGEGQCPRSEELTGVRAANMVTRRKASWNSFVLPSTLAERSWVVPARVYSVFGTRCGSRIRILAVMNGEQSMCSRDERKGFRPLY